MQSRHGTILTQVALFPSLLQENQHNHNNRARTAVIKANISSVCTKPNNAEKLKANLFMDFLDGSKVHLVLQGCHLWM